MNRFCYLVPVLFSILSYAHLSAAQDYSFITPNSENACQLIPKEGFGDTPNVSLVLPVGAETKNKTNFFKIIKMVQKNYKPLFKSHDLDVVWDVNWESTVENAFAAPNGEGGKRKLILHGGLYRHSQMTPDGYLFVLCHELGHIMGGAPQHAWIPELSAEGQADYYSTNTCLPIIFAGADNINYIKKLNVPLSVKLDCDRSWKKEEDSAICQRSIMAAYSFAKILFRSPNGEGISFDNPHDGKVSETINSWYPENQCRFDTAMAGSLCSKKLNVTQELGDAANCNLHQLIKSGARPQCWYKTPGM